MQIEFITSKDGSHTLYLPHLKETYHSLHGAIVESKYVFIDAGLSKIAEKKEGIKVLEVGFGTGLNALLTLMLSIRESKKIYYKTLEPFPLQKEIYEKLNYLDLLNRHNLREDFFKMHEAGDGETISLNENFIFSRYKATLENFSPSGISADVVYYDAFAPSKQPEVWSLDNLKKIRGMMNPGSILVTYCASGQFKRDLKEAGFNVEVLPGPPGKKEMTRGTI